MARYTVTVKVQQREFLWSADRVTFVRGPIWTRWLFPTVGSSYEGALTVLRRRVEAIYPKHQFTFVEA